MVDHSPNRFAYFQGMLKNGEKCGLRPPLKVLKYLYSVCELPLTESHIFILDLHNLLWPHDGVGQRGFEARLWQDDGRLLQVGRGAPLHLLFGRHVANQGPETVSDGHPLLFAQGVHLQGREKEKTEALGKPVNCDFVFEQK